jgi:hypothetical protein
MGQILTDIAKETEPTTQQLLRREHKRKAEISAGETCDTLKCYQNEGIHEEREDEFRQGLRVYEIQGTRQAGYILNLRSTHMTGAGTIQLTEQEVMRSQGNVDLEEQTLDCPTDEDEQDSWEALVEFWAGTSQDVDQEAEIVTATDLTQSDTARITTATSESEPVRTPATDSTRDQTEKVTTEISETEEERPSRSAGGKEKSK